MYKYIITPLLLCSLTTFAAADDVQIKPDHPDRHVVVKGDTLWDISAKFLKDPWQWPKLWKMNRAQIKNPHRIYPGDVVVFDPNTKTLRLLRETVNLEPGVKIESVDKQGIDSISPNIIAPFINQPLVIDKADFDKSSSILGGDEGRVSFSQGSKIYLDKVDESESLYWYVYREGKQLKDPVTKEVLGTEAIHLGSAKIVKFGQPATAIVSKAKQEIMRGDKLVAAPNEIQENYIPHPPEGKVAGHIISIYGGLREAGKNAIVTVNLGETSNIEAGHVLAVYRDGGTVDDPKYEKPKDKLPELKLKVEKRADGMYEINNPEEEVILVPPGKIKLPDQRVGLIMIFRTFDKVSYGLVMQASQPIHELDIVKKP